VLLYAIGVPPARQFAENRHINRLGLAEIVIRRQFKHAFERSVADFHDQKIAFVRPQNIRAAATDAQTMASTVIQDFRFSSRPVPP